MHSGSRSAWRYRLRSSGLAPVAVQLAAPVALGLLIGGVLAYQAGSANDAVHPVPLGAVATPTPSFIRPATPPAATASAASLTTAPAATTTASGDCGIVVLASPPGTRRLANPYRLTGGATTAGPGCP